jgi:hypothetical protein
VRVTAELHGDIGVRRRCEVSSHDRGGAAEIRPWRRGHPAVPDGYQVLGADLVLRQDCRERVVSAAVRIPVRKAAPWHDLARRAAFAATLGPARVRVILDDVASGDGRHSPNYCSHQIAYKHFDRQRWSRTRSSSPAPCQARAISQLETLRYRVTLEPLTQAG